MKPFTHLQTFLKSYDYVLPKKCHVLGLDVGTRYVGIAISDHRYRRAIPTEHCFIRQDKRDVNIPYIRSQLNKLCTDQSVIALVVGIPTNEHKLGDKIIDFVKRLTQEDSTTLPLFNLPVLLQDESYSTFEAYRQFRGGEVKWNSHQLELTEQEKKQLDCISAAKILQRTLDDIYIQTRDHKKAMKEKV